MTLATMQPAPEWTPGAAEQAAVEELAGLSESLTIRVWGGDWCDDCHAVLPDFAAALAAAGIDPADVAHHPVEKRDDGSKAGPLVTDYDIERIPTIVIEREGEEIARFVESTDRPAIVVLVDAIAASSHRA